MVLVSSIPTKIFSSLLIWLHLVAASASRKRSFLRTTLKMCRVRSFAFSRVPTPPPSTMLMCGSSSPQFVPLMSSRAVLVAAGLNFG
ncbi:unnamed protein product [Prunus armeniaca]|uniref:Secreted protein n=1 Tax=Prunus armeniaca TaxID=36596 RepID=A0A6J5UZB7_PRUAR|nr:unnamed protein product [Prunus armeniaca]